MNEVAVVKPIEWIGTSRDTVRQFPREARKKVGFELQAVQRGQNPSDFKPMPSVGPGVYEIRVHILGAYRVFYLAKFQEAIYVLHAFEKKSQKTAKRDIELGRRRYKTAQNYRKEH